MATFSGSINSNTQITREDLFSNTLIAKEVIVSDAWVGVVPGFELILSNTQITREDLFSNALIAKEVIVSDAWVYKTFSDSINSDVQITKEAIVSDTYVYKTFSDSINSDVRITKEAIVSDTYVYTSGSFPSQTRDGVVLGRGIPVSSSRSAVAFGITYHSNETIVADVITSAVLDLTTANTPLTYNQYNWAYDWVTRQWNGCIVKFEVRQHDDVGELTGETWQEVQKGQVVTNVKRYHQWRAHVWASGSQDFELHQFTIKAYVNYSASDSYTSIIR